VNQQTEEGGDDRGDVRYMNLLWLYRYHHLVLVRRYGSSCRENLERLDSAYAKVLELVQDSVKKLRLHLQRALNAVHDEESV
jgi:hypothetical protein